MKIPEKCIYVLVILLLNEYKRRDHSVPGLNLWLGGINPVFANGSAFSPEIFKETLDVSAVFHQTFDLKFETAVFFGRKPVFIFIPAGGLNRGDELFKDGTVHFDRFHFFYYGKSVHPG